MKDLSSSDLQAPLRPPSHVMRLHQLGAMFPTRLSFLRIVLRRLVQERAVVTRPVWEMDDLGYGRAVYSLPFGGHVYSLVALSQPLDDAARSDRVIATAWDAAFVLYDGVPSDGELNRIAEAAPRQEAGRFTERDLVLSRANKSVRLWSEIVDALRSGAQPSLARINEVGYLMRTTAVYGNGKFGIADRHLYAERPGLETPFAAEMLTVWLIRNFTHDLIEHAAGKRLDRAAKRHLGIGNATGLGMAPFLVTHPVLLNNWMRTREAALARIRGLDTLSEDQAQEILELTARVAAHLDQWSTDDARASEDIAWLRAAWPSFAKRWLSLDALSRSGGLDSAVSAAAERGPALEELVIALLLEPFGHLVDDLSEALSAPENPRMAALPTTQDIRQAIDTHFGWALDVNYDDPHACAQFWYVSEEKLEPRLGQRHSEPGAERESPLDIGRRISALYADLPGDSMTTTAFLETRPRHLLAVERVEGVVAHPYAEIQDNLIAQTCRPIDMLRAKLAMFGASKFDPKSDLWTRITLAQGAPLADELGRDGVDHGWLPAFVT